MPSVGDLQHGRARIALYSCYDHSIDGWFVCIALVHVIVQVIYRMKSLNTKVFRWTRLTHEECIQRRQELCPTRTRTERAHVPALILRFRSPSGKCTVLLLSVIKVILGMMLFVILTIVTLAQGASFKSLWLHGRRLRVFNLQRQRQFCDINEQPCVRGPSQLYPRRSGARPHSLILSKSGEFQRAWLVIMIQITNINWRSQDFRNNYCWEIRRRPWVQPWSTLCIYLIRRLRPPYRKKPLTCVNQEFPLGLCEHQYCMRASYLWYPHSWLLLHDVYNPC